jgi:NAD(P)-dependent dehydrogenase (short-subunit alcohol dehydrogenase family)
MSKAAQNSLVRTLAVEEKANGISVFAVRPGVVDVSPPNLTSEIVLIDRPM